MAFHKRFFIEVYSLENFDEEAFIYGLSKVFPNMYMKVFKAVNVEGDSISYSKYMEACDGVVEGS